MLLLLLLPDDGGVAPQSAANAASRLGDKIGRKPLLVFVGVGIGYALANSFKCS